MDLADGLETGSPYLHLHSPDLALSRSTEARAAVLPPFLCERAAAAIFLEEIDIVFLRVARVLLRQRVHYGHSQFIILNLFTSDRVYLSGCLAAFNLRN